MGINQFSDYFAKLSDTISRNDLWKISKKIVWFNLFQYKDVSMMDMRQRRWKAL